MHAMTKNGTRSCNKKKPIKIALIIFFWIRNWNYAIRKSLYGSIVDHRVSNSVHFLYKYGMQGEDTQKLWRRSGGAVGHWGVHVLIMFHIAANTSIQVCFGPVQYSKQSIPHNTRTAASVWNVTPIVNTTLLLFLQTPCKLSECPCVLTKDTEY